MGALALAGQHGSYNIFGRARNFFRAKTVQAAAEGILKTGEFFYIRKLAFNSDASTIMNMIMETKDVLPAAAFGEALSLHVGARAFGAISRYWKLKTGGLGSCRRIDLEMRCLNIGRNAPVASFKTIKAVEAELSNLEEIKKAAFLLLCSSVKGTKTADYLANGNLDTALYELMISNPVPYGVRSAEIHLLKISQLSLSVNI